ncbi:unnamed protein product [Linum tenue]|uniref:TIR domain-containing protein n=1 Tax=Linum tenue TaxID=586396 RepID=A0AAV0IHL7_9ROSI|nr:unnamed protein product [Linum tenue]
MDAESPLPSLASNPHHRSATVLRAASRWEHRSEQELHAVLSSSLAAAEGGKNKYEVFVSFNGQDNRRGFTTHLCHSLSSKLGISVFYKDEIRFDPGASVIAPELLRAIDGSRIAVVVLSRNYADSTCCLDELLHILRHRKSGSLPVIPVFFDVDPSDFRKPSGGRIHSAAGDDALAELANLPGFATADYGNDMDMIREIVGKIWNELSSSTTTTALPSIISNINPLVGMEKRVNAVISLLHLDATRPDGNDVRMIGICGPSGSGKTTVAMAVFDAIRSGFESSTYIASVGESSTTRTGLFRLQKQLADEIGGEGVEMGTWPAAEVFERLKRAYRGKKLLLILDGITHEVQLFRLGADRSLFGPGSRVIITCREQYLVNNDYQTRVDSMYETQLLDKNEARVLLSLVAFGQEDFLEDYRDVGEQILDYAGGVPFVVEVLGRSLRGRSVSEWEYTIEKLKRIPPTERSH